MIYQRTSFTNQRSLKTWYLAKSENKRLLYWTAWKWWGRIFHKISRVQVSLFQFSLMRRDTPAACSHNPHKTLKAAKYVEANIWIDFRVVSSCLILLVFFWHQIVLKKTNLYHISQIYFYWSLLPSISTFLTMLKDCWGKLLILWQLLPQLVPH